MSSPSNLLASVIYNYTIDLAKYISVSLVIVGYSRRRHDTYRDIESEAGWYTVLKDEARSLHFKYIATHTIDKGLEDVERHADGVL